MSEKLKILIIDDNEDDRILYRRTLGKSDTPYDIIEADNGEAGLEQIAEQPDCILLDYSLPGHNGVEVLKRIRAVHPFVPVVMLTGQGNETVAVAAMKEGAQDYIAKSTITPDTLERVVRVAVAHGQMQRRIQEQHTSLEIFTYALAHDLREPTHSIRAFSDLLAKSENFSEKGHVYLTHIQKAALRMHQLIDAVYLYARLDASNQMEKDKVAMEDIVKAATENLAQRIQTANATITHDALPELLVNQTQMLQLLQNLISNAICHGGDHIHVHVSAHKYNDCWEISIRDNGPGILPEHAEIIFDPFKRMSNSKERGLGMGLAISRKIAEFHGGKIRCESKLGEGATFIFTLPHPPQLPDAAPHSDVHAIRINGHSDANPATRLARLLLVDDNEADVELNRLMLIEQSHLECEVLVANNGQEALLTMHEAHAQGKPIDLVLLDINMPVMSGYEMLAQVCTDPTLNDTVVVMCSTSDHDRDRRTATLLGAAGYLVKPPQFPQFKAIVEENPHFTLQQQGDQYILFRAA